MWDYPAAAAALVHIFRFRFCFRASIYVRSPSSGITSALVLPCHNTVTRLMLFLANDDGLVAGDVGGLSQSLVSLARRAGSQDNISVLVVVLRPVGLIAPPEATPEATEPEVVAAFCRPASMDILDAVDNANNPFLPSNG